MPTDTIVFSMFMIFSGAALLATLALYTRQSLLVAYLLLGAIIGPWGLSWLSDPSAIQQIGDVGIIFLLFLLGLHLQPRNLIRMLGKMVFVGVISSLLFGIVGYGIAQWFGYSDIECLLIGTAMMFSSTIIGLKLLPTTILHHQHTGELMISVLLFQDLIAIVVLLLMHGANDGGVSWQIGLLATLGLPGMLLFAFLVERFALIKLIRRFDKIREYIFLLSIGWCLGMAELAGHLGLSEEIGAFIAGVAIAESPIALFIAESLKPLRDFFLVIFFFAIGANFNTHYLPSVWMPAVLLAAVMLVFKPYVFKWLLQWSGEPSQVSMEVGMRLGQASEFSLLVAYLASNTALISDAASYLIQATTIITFIVSSYLVVFRYPTPVAASDRLRRD